jgi:hypothetical protein
MIDLSQDVLVALLVRSLLCGGLLGVFYDLIRAVKMFLGVSYGEKQVSLTLAGRVVIYVVTFVTDVIFWLTAGLVSIALLYGLGGGVFRGMTYLCLAAGFALYYVTVGRLVLKLERVVISLIKRILKKTVSLLLRPTKMALRWLIFLYHLTIGKIIGRIKEGMLVKRLDGLFLEDARGDVEPSGSLSESLEKGYKKEGRVSFGGKKDIR